MWDLILSDDQAMISASVEDFLRDELPLARLRPNAPPVDRDISFKAIAALGWLGLGLSDEQGGTGLGPVEEALVQRLCGRHLVSPSILASIVAAHVAIAAGEGALAAAFASGERRAALVVKMSGNEVYALDWAENDLLLVWDDIEAGLFAPSEFTDRKLEAALDDSLSLHRGQLGSAPVCRANGSGPEIALRAELLLAASLTGLADGACSLAVEYAKSREQFGKPIGAFQAIKHRCADMYMRAETAGYLVGLASLKLSVGAPDAALQVAAAKLKAAQAAHENGRAVIQVHGGLGFQAECDAHWFMKRAHVYDQAGGDMLSQAARVFGAPTPHW